MTMKRLTAASAAFAILAAALASCGKPVPAASENGAAGNGTSTDTVSVQETTVSPAQAEALKRITNGRYKYEEIDLPLKYDYIYNLQSIGEDSFTFVYYSSASNNGRSVITDSSFSELAEIQYDIPEEAKQYDTCDHVPFFDTDGSFTVLATAEDHGGISAPESEEEAESFDWDNYYDNFTSHYFACSYDKDGKLLNSSEVTFPEEYFQYGQVYLSILTSFHGDIVGILDSKKIIRISPSDGSYEIIYEAEGDPYTFNESNLIYDRDGRLFYVTDEYEESEYGEISNRYLEYREIREDNTLSDPVTIDDYYYCSGCPLMRGYGEYQFLLGREDALYGIRDDGTEEMLLNWDNSGITATQLCPAGNGEFFGLLDNHNTSDGSVSQTLIRLSPSDASDIENRSIITIGTPATYVFDKNIINSYNHSQDNNYVEIKTYGEYDFNGNGDNYDSAIDSSNKALETALVSGDIPDIIAGLEYPRVANLSNKGVFADLGQLMDKDSEFSRSAFVPCFLECLTSPDGGIYTISNCFSVDSKLVKTKVWDKPTWTLDEMIEVFDSHEDTATHLYDGDTKMVMLQNMTNTMDGLIDYDKATCNFNSSKFIKILEFCNRFVDEEITPDKSIDGGYANQMYWTDKFTWFERDLVLTQDCSAEGVRYCMTKYLEGGGEDMIFVGYPSDSGSGGRIAVNDYISISEACENKDAAWDFIRYYIDNSFGYGYSALNSRFEEEVYSEVGAEHTASGNPIQPETKEEADMIKEYILGCSTIENSFPNELWSIICEEANEYFSGAITAEEAAERIQNRSEIYVSENQ